MAQRSVKTRVRRGGGALALALAAAVSSGMVSAEEIFSDGFEFVSACAWGASAGDARAYAADFDLPDQAGWPAPWLEAGEVDVAELVSGALRFRPLPSGYSLARLVADRGTRDVEVRFRVRFDDVSSQGVGFYVRQNGGYLDQTTPVGEGYAVFVEGFRGTPGIGIWKEDAGHEISLDILFDEALGLVDDVWFVVRFRALQIDAAQTLLQAKLWPEGDAEPAAWQVEVVDATPSLQGIGGGIALDSWSSIQSPGPIVDFTWVDDVEVRALCSPAMGFSAPETVSDTLQFAEGPVWRGDHLLFTELDANQVRRLDPPDQLSVWNPASQEANGLHLDGDGTLLAAEHDGRRISRQLGDGSVVEVVGAWQGMAFNSPNDLDVLADGAVVFTDPPYGLDNPGLREIPFNGVFRWRQDEGLSVLWQGAEGVNAPNGVIASAEGDALFVSDTQQGQLLRFELLGDGSAGPPSVVRSGLSIPDGMCRDVLGNVYLATWNDGLQIFDRQGGWLGELPVAGQATNCTFGGADRRTLYVTTTTGLLAYGSTVAGVP